VGAGGRIGFDGTWLTPDGRGHARVQREFLRTAAALGVEDLTVFVPERPDEGALPAVLSWRYVRAPASPMVVWEQWRRPRLARREGLAVVFTLSERAALWGPPEVAWVFEHPRLRARRARETAAPLRQRVVDAVTLALFPLSMRRAAVVLAGSEATARDLPVPARVVYPGVSESFAPGDAEPSYFLHLASDDPRENGRVVLEAYAQLGGGPELVIGGRPPASLRAAADELGVPVRWTGYVPDEELPALYRGAIAYVDPSLYEGFGQQALEALACGTPAIASSATSLPEVVGDAGILVRPDDVGGFAAAMQRLAGDRDLRADLSRRALERAAGFSWERTVRECLAACGEAAG
jgi:glycosyltransferase involved in cell wall biosynthesis